MNALERKTREQILEEAKKIHAERKCRCDPKYLYSCPNFATAILETVKLETR